MDVKSLQLQRAQATAWSIRSVQRELCNEGRVGGARDGCSAERLVAETFVVRFNGPETVGEALARQDVIEHLGPASMQDRPPPVGRDDMTLVPLGALFRQGEAWVVFVVERSPARVRIVEVGARNAQHAEVVGGLAAGERVILHPSDRILEGVRVVERHP
jgi:multidrug efflux pump subunit AcrA (membrane-fusion protein)